MKRPTAKLTVRRETLRALANKEIASAVGGDAAAPGTDSRAAMCPVQAASATVPPGG